MPWLLTLTLFEMSMFPPFPLWLNLHNHDILDNQTMIGQAQLPMLSGLVDATMLFGNIVHLFHIYKTIHQTIWCIIWLTSCCKCSLYRVETRWSHMSNMLNFFVWPGALQKAKRPCFPFMRLKHRRILMDMGVQLVIIGKHFSTNLGWQLH